MSDNNWIIETDANNIAWLHFNTPNASANLLSQAAIKELDDIVKDFQSNTPRAVIILSDKKDSFIFGADIKEFTALENKEQALDRADPVRKNKGGEAAQAVLDVFSGIEPEFICNRSDIHEQRINLIPRRKIE